MDWETKTPVLIQMPKRCREKERESPEKGGVGSLSRMLHNVGAKRSLILTERLGLFGDTPGRRNREGENNRVRREESVLISCERRRHHKPSHDWPEQKKTGVSIKRGEEPGGLSA